MYLIIGPGVLQANRGSGSSYDREVSRRHRFGQRRTGHQVVNPKNTAQLSFLRYLW